MDNRIEKKDFEFQLPDIEVREPESKRLLAEMNLRLSEKLVEFKKHCSSYADFTKKDYQLRLSEKRCELEKRNLSHADLLDRTAMLTLEEESNDIQLQAKDSQLAAQELIIAYLHVCIKDQQRIIETVKESDELIDLLGNAAEETEARMEQYQRKKKAAKAADALHDLPGGSREKQKKIRKIWASGKYTSRDIGAEQECAALEMSFSAARKALRNTPTPT